MKEKEVVWKKYDNLNSQVENLVISPTGQILHIEYQSHDYYLEKLVEEEFGIDDNKLWDLKKEARTLGADYVRDIDIIIGKFGYISVHTSGRGVGWIQLPEKINEKQLSAITTEYALGHIPPLLYDIFINYETISAPVKEFFGLKDWWRVYQVDISWVKEKKEWTSDRDFENGYSVDVI